MSDIKNFLKVLNKMGYPNPKLLSIAQGMNYDLEYFLVDLKKELGVEGVVEFCDKAIEKLSGEKGIRVNIESYHNKNEYCYIHIYPIYYDEEESKEDVISKHKWGESRIFGRVFPDDQDEEPYVGYFTIQEIIDDTDMGSLSDLDELLDHIRDQAYGIVQKNCGFGIWWE